jgi:hypothetical protein
VALTVCGHKAYRIITFSLFRFTTGAGTFITP